MKNLIQYLKLWQKKRGELQIDTNADADWMDMHALLDKHMPGNDDDRGGSKTGGIGLLSIILLIFSVAAVVYFAAKMIQTKQKADYTKNKIHSGTRGFNAGKDPSVKSGKLQPGSDSVTNANQYSDAGDKTGRGNPSVKSGKLQPGSDSVTNTNQYSDAGDKTGRNKFSAKSGNLKSRLNSVGNIKQYKDAGNKPGRDIPSAKSGKLQSGLDSVGDIKQYSDAENKIGSNLAALGKMPSGVLNSGGAKISPSKTAGIKKAANIKKNIAAANLGFVQIVNGTSAPDKVTAHGRHSIRKINTGLNRPGSSQDTTDKDNFTGGNNTSLGMINDPYHSQSKELALLPEPRQSPFTSSTELTNFPVANYKIVRPAKPKKDKAKQSNGTFEWGVLMGANSNNSFTAKNLNHNYYGSLPVDLFTGAYGVYHLNPKWGIGTQVTILSPMVVKGSTYTDSPATLNNRNVSDSKKVYSVQFPFYTTYQFTKFIGFKAGPVISFPVKQFNTYTQTDSLSSSFITHSRYDQKPDYSFMGGINFKYNWIIFETSYLKGLTSHSITSDSFIHKSTNNTFQFTIRLRFGVIKE